MKKLPLKRTLPAMTIAAVLGAGAISVAQTERRATPRPRVPQRQFVASPGSDASTADSRAIRDLLEALERSSTEEVRSGRINRFFTDPAVIITNGRMHRVDWSRVRDNAPADRQDDRSREDDRAPGEERSREVERAPGDDRARDNDRDGEDRFDPRLASARLEALQIRRIDPRTVVVLYTAVLPDRGGVFRQPVVATLIREGSRDWRIASYTAENAAIPGSPSRDEVD
jgi:hypothetical protein